MGDWQELAQSVVIGIIFSFLVAKLISMVMSFREENLRIVREGDLASVEPIVERVSEREPIVEKPRIVEEEVSASEREERLSESFLGEDEDDWEGVESTELDEEFSAATAFVAAAAADRLSQKVSNDVQLQLYGLYKIATEGPCNTPQPSALKMTARAKWTAWQRLGTMPPEEAMQKYITIVTELYPSWASGSTSKNKDRDRDTTSSSAKGPMGPVFSSLVYEESEHELKLDAIHDAAREGERDNLLKYIESGVSANLKDGEGRTPLHWAVDRGHLKVVELLISNNADVNAKVFILPWCGGKCLVQKAVSLGVETWGPAFSIKLGVKLADIYLSQTPHKAGALCTGDDEGQTPLHYAAMCDREAIAEFLVKQNADTDIKDNDGCSPSDLCESNWPWMNQSSSKTG